MFSIPDAVLQRLTGPVNRNFIVAANTQPLPPPAPGGAAEAEAPQATTGGDVPPDKKTYQRRARTSTSGSPRRLALPLHEGLPLKGSLAPASLSPFGPGSGEVIRFSDRRGDDDDDDFSSLSGEDDEDLLEGSGEEEEEASTYASSSSGKDEREERQQGRQNTKMSRKDRRRAMEAERMARRAALVDRHFNSVVHADARCDAALEDDEEELMESDGTFSSSASCSRSSSSSLDLPSSSSSSSSSSSGSESDDESDLSSRDSVPSSPTFGEQEQGGLGFGALRRAEESKQQQQKQSSSSLLSSLVRNKAPEGEGGSSCKTSYMIRPPQKFRSLYFESYLPPLPPALLQPTRGGDETAAMPAIAHHTLVAFAHHHRHTDRNMNSKGGNRHHHHHKQNQKRGAQAGMPPPSNDSRSPGHKSRRSHASCNAEEEALEDGDGAGTAPPPPSITIQGPCAVVGGIGGRRREEMLLSGFRLGSCASSLRGRCGASGRSVVLWTENERGILEVDKALHLPQIRGVGSPTPSSSSSPTTNKAGGAQNRKGSTPTQAKQQSAQHDWKQRVVKGWRPTASNATMKTLQGAPDALKELVQGPGKGGLVFDTAKLTAEEEEEEEEVEDIENVFGPIDWAWVRAVLDAWSGFFGGAEHMPAVSLILHPYDPAHRTGARRFYLKRNLKKKAQRKRRRYEREAKAAKAAKAADGGGDEPNALQEGTTARLRGQGKGGRDDMDGNAYLEVPSFISRHRAPQVDRRVLPHILHDIFTAAAQGATAALPSSSQLRRDKKLRAQQQQLSEEEERPPPQPNRSGGKPTSPNNNNNNNNNNSSSSSAAASAGHRIVAVVGSTNTGKSTLCRFLVNALLSLSASSSSSAEAAGIAVPLVGPSRRGVLWLDLDLGQPEFGVPGELGLYRVRQPLLRPHHVASVEPVQTFFLGSRSVVCPVAVGNALRRMCELIQALQREDVTGADEKDAPLPVVVNTHGWVLHTGRRTTVEVLRRLQPRHVLHLLREGEPCWTQPEPEAQDIASDRDDSGDGVGAQGKQKGKRPTGHSNGEAKRTRGGLEPGLPGVVAQYRHRFFHYEYLTGNRCRCITNDGDSWSTTTTNTNTVLRTHMVAPWMKVENGLNGEVIKKRFLLRVSLTAEETKKNTREEEEEEEVRHAAGDGAQPAVFSTQLLSRLPAAGAKEIAPAPASYPYAFTTAHVLPVVFHHSGSSLSGVSALQQHERNFSAGNTKGMASRRECWMRCLMPLIDYYTTKQERLEEAHDTTEHLDKRAKGEEEEEEEPQTTLLEAPLSRLRLLVLADADEKQLARRITSAFLYDATGRSHPPAEAEGAESSCRCTALQLAAASLERAVVGVQLGATTAPPPSSLSTQTGGLVPLTSLSALPSGFPVTCYGFVESTEAELLGTTAAQGEGWIRLRVPLAPSVVRGLLQRGDGDGGLSPSSSMGGVALAYAAGLRAETNFMEAIYC